MSKKATIIICAVLVVLLVVWLAASNRIIAAASGAEEPQKVEFRPAEQENKRVYFSLSSITGVGSGLTENYAISMWAFCETKTDNAERSISLFLKNEDTCYELKNEKPDNRIWSIGDAFPTLKILHEYIGFEKDFCFINVPDGVYDVYVGCRENDADYGIYPFTIAGNGIQIVKDGADVSMRSWQSVQTELSVTLAEEGGLESNVDATGIQDDTVIVQGWCAQGEAKAENAEVYIRLENESGETRLYTTDAALRLIAEGCKGGEADDFYAFGAKIPAREIADGTWNMTLLLEENGRLYAAPNRLFVKNGTAIGIYMEG